MAKKFFVIGGGAAGLATAGTARRRGWDVTVVTNGPPGGDCTFYGCVPSKTLLAAGRDGLAYDDALARVRRVIAEIAANESVQALESQGIRVIDALATFTGPRTLDVAGTTERADRVVIATGASAAWPPIEGIRGPNSLTNVELFSLTKQPHHLAIVGGGPIGVEMAEAFVRVGSRVTLFEGAPRLLPREEPEASVLIENWLSNLGVRVVTGARVARVDHARGVTLTLADGSKVEADRLLVATGRVPSTEGLGLKAAGVALNQAGRVKVNDRLRTSTSGVYAAGDVCQLLTFTHVAYETGRVAAMNATSPVPLARFHPRATPMVTFTGLEVARVGSVESEVAGPGVRVAYLPLSEVDRARAEGRTEGFVKIITEPRGLSRHRLGGRIVGATIVAPRAGEMIGELALAIRANLWPSRIALASHAYPTWSIAVQQTTAQLFGEYGGRHIRPARNNEEG